MFKLDDSFLKEIGKDSMPEAEKAAFLNHLQGELELRVGERMSEGLSEAQLSEFEKIIDGDAITIELLLQEIPDYKNDKIYQKLLAAGNIDDSPKTLSEFASIKWLEKNRPDYQDLVAQVSSELKAEVVAGKDAI